MRTDYDRQTDDDLEKSEQKRLRSRQEGLPELHPHQYGRTVDVGSGSTSQDNLQNSVVDIAGLVTPSRQVSTVRAHPSSLELVVLAKSLGQVLVFRKCCKHGSEDYKALLPAPLRD